MSVRSDARSIDSLSKKLGGLDIAKCRAYRPQGYAGRSARGCAQKNGQYGSGNGSRLGFVHGSRHKTRYLAGKRRTGQKFARFSHTHRPALEPGASRAQPRAQPGLLLVDGVWTRHVQADCGLCGCQFSVRRDLLPQRVVHWMTGPEAFCQRCYDGRYFARQRATCPCGSSFMLDRPPYAPRMCSGRGKYLFAPRKWCDACSVGKKEQAKMGTVCRDCWRSAKENASECARCASERRSFARFLEDFGLADT